MKRLGHLNLSREVSTSSSAPRQKTYGSRLRFSWFRGKNYGAIARGWRPQLLISTGDSRIKKDQGTRMSETNLSRRGFILNAIASSTSLLTLSGALAGTADTACAG